MIQERAGFAPELHSARAARRFVADALAADGLDAEVPVLLVSELATNAVLHARTEFLVRTHVRGGRIRVEVEDYNTRAPVLVHTPPEATSGRGLHLVQSLAEAWGVESHTDGKVVWFEVPAVTARNHAFA